MTTTRASLAGKSKLNGSTGIGDALIKTFFDNLDTRHIAIVELVGDSRTEKQGDRDPSVLIRADMIEVADSPDVEHYLRGLARALYRQREPQQLELNDNEADLEPTVDEVLGRAPQTDTCPAPGCDLADEHDGDHTDTGYDDAGDRT